VAAMLNAKSYITAPFVSAQMALRAIPSSIASQYQVCSVEYDIFLYKILKFVFKILKLNLISTLLRPYQFMI